MILLLKVPKEATTDKSDETTVEEEETTQSVNNKEANDGDKHTGTADMADKALCNQRRRY